jgi:hypothetical protein
VKGSDEDKIASVLKGNTLRVYWHVLRSRGEVVGVRDTQRALGFSSPALAIYHLDKLVELGLVEKANGEYHLVKAVNVGVLKQFVWFGYKFVRCLNLEIHGSYIGIITLTLGSGEGFSPRGKR